MVLDGKTMITQKEVKNLFIYNKRDGTFKWRKPSGKNIYTHSSGGYPIVKVGGKTFIVHRLIWLYVTGDNPDTIVKHSNGNLSDNRWDNLVSLSGTEEKVTTKKIDWKLIIQELDGCGITISRLSRLTGVPATTIGRYKTGSEPAYSVGIVILKIHKRYI